MQPERQEKLIEVGRALLTELELEPLLQRILEVGRELTGARYVALGVLDEDRGRLERFLTLGIDRQTHEAIGDLPRGHGVLGVLIRDPRPLRLPNVGAHIESYGFPVGHPPMTTFLGVPVLIRGQAWGNLYLTEKEGGAEFDEEDEQAVIVLADWAAIAIHNARVFQELQDHRQELERAVRSFETTTEIARALSGEIALPRVLELVVKRARALVRASSMVLGLCQDDTIKIVAIAGDIDAEVVGAEYPMEGSISGKVVRARKPERLADVRNRLHFALGDYIVADAGIMVPLTFRGEALGVLCAFDRTQDGPQFSLDDERLLVAFASSAAAAVSTAQNVALEGLRRSMQASEQERTRWARELHDQTLQELGGLRVLLSAARRRNDPEVLAGAVDDSIERLTAGIADLRSLITDLRPPALDELGVGAALEALVRRAQAETDKVVELELELDYEQGRAAERHTPELEATLYRIVQEAMTNAVKHSNCERITVHVADLESVSEVRVTDDGDGFDSDARAPGFGLIGIRERAALHDGEVEIASTADGTTVTARLPLTRRTAKEAPEPSRATG